MKKLFHSRFSLLLAFIGYYILASTLVRIGLILITWPKLDIIPLHMLKSMALGLYFDFGVALYFSVFYSIYLVLWPSKWVGNTMDKAFTYFVFSLMIFISLFSFFSEFPFWEEFSVRFNFIAVDYLIYTYEVIENINQSYPIPLLLGGLFLIILLVFFIFNRLNVFKSTFGQKPWWMHKIAMGLGMLLGVVLYTLGANNHQGEWSNNTYYNELSKNGVFSFFAAFRSNELDYDLFYAKLPLNTSYEILRNELQQSNQTYINSKPDNISRLVQGHGQNTPNIIMVTIESFSADFLKTFGNTQHLTPHYEDLANKGLFFTQMFATGTRTVRGMEALTLSVPPTPGNSIVRRPNNDHLYSVASVLKQKNYQLNFIYGGDGYFDNMNAFFGGQGFDIVDRDRGNPLPDNITTKRMNIEDSEVNFENAWGISDEDIYKQAIKYADLNARKNKPFFQFVMTTSNHKPYTYPTKKVALPQGNREGAVQYTDFALGQFIKAAQTKPWFKNTIFVLVADHCASSAGKWEIDVAKHHIPAVIYNFPNQKPQKVNTLMSQIDLMPTLFGMLNWNYQSSWYGKDVFKLSAADEPRALIGNYRTLGLLKDGVFTEINDRKQVKQYGWNAQTKEMNESSSIIENLKNITIAYYQTASERFKNGKMKHPQK